jgi:hypothetical protein
MNTPKVVPFNTGKVSIGSRYEPPKNYTVSRDMENLQRGLLESRLERRAQAAMVLVYVIAIVSVGFVWVIR